MVKRNSEPQLSPELSSISSVLFPGQKTHHFISFSVALVREMKDRWPRAWCQSPTKDHHTTPIAMYPDFTRQFISDEEFPHHSSTQFSTTVSTEDAEGNVSCEDHQHHSDLK